MGLLLFIREEDLNRNLFEGLLCYLEEDILMRVIVILMIIGDLMMDKGSLEEEDIMKGVEGHQIEEITMIEVTLEEEGPLMIEDPLMMEKPPDDGELPDDGGPPDDGEPPRNGRNPRHPGRQGPPGPPGPPGPVRPITVQQP